MWRPSAQRSRNSYGPAFSRPPVPAMNERDEGFVLGVHERHELAALERRRRVAEDDRRRARVADRAVAVEQDDDVGGVLHERREPGLALAGDELLGERRALERERDLRRQGFETGVRGLGHRGFRRDRDQARELLAHDDRREVLVPAVALTAVVEGERVTGGQLVALRFVQGVEAIPELGERRGGRRAREDPRAVVVDVEPNDRARTGERLRRRRSWPGRCLRGSSRSRALRRPRAVHARAGSTVCCSRTKPAMRTMASTNSVMVAARTTGRSSGWCRIACVACASGASSEAAPSRARRPGVTTDSVCSGLLVRHGPHRRVQRRGPEEHVEADPADLQPTGARCVPAVQLHPSVEPSRSAATPRPRRASGGTRACAGRGSSARRTATVSTMRSMIG